MATPMRRQYKEAVLEIEHQVRGEDGKFIRRILPAERDTIILWGIYRGLNCVLKLLAHHAKMSISTASRPPPSQSLTSSGIEGSADY